jgi:L-fuculose-phosphate aldolase
MTPETYAFDDPRFQIAAARRMLYRGGCDSGIAGHVSVRAPGEDAFWITPFGYFDETTPQDVVKLSWDLELLEGERPVSPAVQFHAAFYRRREDVRAIVHTHSLHVAVLATAPRFLGMYCQPAVMFDGEQALYEDDGSGTAAEGDRMVAAMGDKRVLLMGHHGAVVVSSSLEAATVESIMLEHCARIHLAAEASGGVEMSRPAIDQLRPEVDKYLRDATWDANVRRLRTSDPDLFAHLA